MGNPPIFSSLFVLWLYCICFVGVRTYAISCSFNEKEALTAFKQSISDPSARLSSWNNGRNCCEWHGVTCSFISGKVTKLDLRNSLGFTNFISSSYDYLQFKRSCLGGEISSSLLELKDLNYLDLSLNDFNGAPVPHFFVMLKNLRYLNLSSAHFGGQIPLHLGNLSNLRYLDLSEYLYEDESNFKVGNLRWLSGLSSLVYLNVGMLDFSRLQTNWMHEINRLSSLLELHLSGCSIISSDTKVGFLNLTSLRVFDLSNNWISSLFPMWLSNLTGLQKLELQNNNLHGTISRDFAKLKNLQYLDLSFNHLKNSGDHMPSYLQNLCKLQFLNLYYNNFSCTIEELLGSFSNCSHNNYLEFLDLSENHLVGEISNSLGSLQNLRHLDLSMNGLWGSLPNSIGNLSLLQSMSISYNLLNGTIPPNNWICKMSSKITSLDLSNNLLEGHLSNLLAFQDPNAVVHSHNNLLVDSILQKYPNLLLLNLQHNLLTGPIPSNIGYLMPNLLRLYLSNNHLSGVIPSSIQTMRNLVVLSLSDNQFSGELFDYWGELKLFAIDLANNSLYGKIPSSIGFLFTLETLVLSYNHFDGKIPKFLQNCPQLLSIDLSQNRLYGSLPMWIGGVVSQLRLLNLRSNHFTGTIPRQWCNLPKLRVLDVSNNNLSGKIPSCLNNWTDMAYNLYVHASQNYSEKTSLVMKGRELEYSVNLDYVLTIDISSNRLNGTIPNEITNLLNLGTLNLSNNHLVGTIPVNIGAMQQLQTLDLSRNRLSGNIPASLASLNFLTHLNLSFNNLTGRIPTGRQLQTLNDPSIYDGNPFLTKSPGDKKTNNDVPVSANKVDGKENEMEFFGFGFYTSMAIGFPIGLNILFFTIFTSRSRRILYIQFIDRVNYNILEGIGFVIIESN
uniref:Leucine-rich repeat-containing N-terminal plant-type domain-containing protein n=2 Tax=Cucumis melo TaxID=3656 RepID=A0A9I9CWL0_CUCME